ncbi:hypothetical protein H7J86_26255 [Mycobacterium hackensackense]|uniref:hypothetical protein n=1 Tax=Mycobacterium hackensackense TaxID=228909 RepID=UPI0022657EE1|nr:hypothetical protein [Mycobacterium hackensackense]MCV7255672.1 hypothetical protein [Mycobacterium hackensackense]
MTPPRKAAPRTANRTKTTPSSEKPPADQAKQPARKRTQSARTPAKRVRKCPKPTDGAKLIREFTTKDDSFARKTLITQAARLADRLEVIARLLSGEADVLWTAKVAGQVANVVVTDLVREERQQSEVLRKLIMDIEKLGGGEGSKDPSGSADDKLVRIISDHYGKKRA